MNQARRHGDTEEERFICLPLCLLLIALLGAAPIDLSSPKATARSLYAAVQAAEEAEVARTLYAPGQDGPALVAATAKLMVAGRHLQVAARQRWGPSAEALVEDMTGADEMKEIDKAKVKIDGDRAELTVAEATRAMVFVRKNGQWRLALSDGAEKHLKERIMRIGRVADVLRQAAADIAAGQYGSVQAARVETARQLEAAMQ